MMDGIGNSFQYNQGNCGLQQYPMQQPNVTSNEQQTTNIQGTFPMNVPLPPNQQALYGNMNRMGLPQFPLQFPQNMAMPGIPNYGTDFSQMLLGRQPNPSAVLPNLPNFSEQSGSQPESVNLSFSSIAEAMPAMNMPKSEGFENNSSSSTCTSSNVTASDQQSAQTHSAQTLALFWSWLSQQQNVCQQQLQVQQQLQQQQLANLMSQVNMNVAVPLQMPQVPIQPGVAFNTDFQRPGLIHAVSPSVESCDGSHCDNMENKIEVSQHFPLCAPFSSVPMTKCDPISNIPLSSCNTLPCSSVKMESSGACSGNFLLPQQTQDLVSVDNCQGKSTEEKKIEDKDNLTSFSGNVADKMFCSTEGKTLPVPGSISEQTKDGTTAQGSPGLVNEEIKPKDTRVSSKSMTDGVEGSISVDGRGNTPAENSISDSNNKMVNNKTVVSCDAVSVQSNPDRVCDENVAASTSEFNKLESAALTFTRLETNQCNLNSNSDSHDNKGETLPEKNNIKFSPTKPDDVKCNSENKTTPKRRQSVQFFFKGSLEGKCSVNNTFNKRLPENIDQLTDESCQLFIPSEEVNSKIIQKTNAQNVSTSNVLVEEKDKNISSKDLNLTSIDRSCADSSVSETGARKQFNSNSEDVINNKDESSKCSANLECDSANVTLKTETDDSCTKNDESIDDSRENMSTDDPRKTETADMLQNFFRVVGKPYRTPKMKNFSPSSASTPSAPGKALVTTTVADHATIVTMSIVNKYASNTSDTLPKTSYSSTQGSITSPKADKGATLMSSLRKTSQDSNLGEDLELSDTTEEEGDSGREEVDECQQTKSFEEVEPSTISEFPETQQIKQEVMDDVTGDQPDLSRDRMDINIRIDDSQYVLQGEQRRWQCRICTKSYTTKHNLVTHILGHNGIKPHMCVVCGKYFKQLSHLNTHMLTHDNIKPHICPICGKAFTQISHLKRHQTVHMESKPHICDVCNRGFTYPSELKAHKEKHIPGRDRCSDCDLDFPSPKLLREHMLSHETREDLTCKECGKMFRYPSQLKDHTLTHTGTRPFMCVECGMDFMKEHHLKAHLFTHTGLRPFKCDVCERSFNQKANLSRHMMIHKNSRDFVCPNCDKTFTQPQTLKAHMVVHAEKKPYQCQVCGKEFGRLHNLQGHMHLHNDTKPYACFCGSSFTLKGNLCRHKKVKHGITESTEDMEEEAVSFLSLLSKDREGNENENTNSTQVQECDIPETKSSRKQRKSTPRRLIRSENKDENISDNSFDRSGECDEGDSQIKDEEDTKQETHSRYFQPLLESQQSDNENTSDAAPSNVRNKRKATKTRKKRSYNSDEESELDKDPNDSEWYPAAKRRRTGNGSKLDKLIRQKFQTE